MEQWEIFLNPVSLQIIIFGNIMNFLKSLLWSFWAYINASGPRTPCTVSSVCYAFFSKMENCKDLAKATNGGVFLWNLREIFPLKF